MPLVSVIIPSFNHAEFVGSAIAGVLAQTISDIEIIIIDDCSSDDSRDVINSFSDSRIKKIFNEQNQGGSEALNIGIRRALSDFIAICNSDDVWIPTKLEIQLPFLTSSEKLGAVFSDVEWIGVEGLPLPANESIYDEVFKLKTSSRYKLTKLLLEHGNRLCHPSVLIRKEVYERVGLYNNYLRQLPDLDRWIRLLRAYDIVVLRNKLLKFRLHSSNTSQPNLTTSTRSINEHEVIVRSWFRQCGDEEFLFTFGFQNELSFSDSNLAHDEKIRYLLDAGGPHRGMFHSIGVDLFASGGRCMDNSLTGISAAEFQQALGNFSPWHVGWPDAPQVVLVAQEPKQPADSPQGLLVEQTRSSELVGVVANRVLSRALRPARRVLNRLQF